MSITKTKKTEIITAFKVSDKDNGGSVESQVAVLTERIRNLTEHMKNNHKDLHSRRGLLRMVNQRKKLLAYIKKRNEGEYEELIKKLGLRKSFFDRHLCRSILFIKYLQTGKYESIIGIGEEEIVHFCILVNMFAECNNE